MAVTSEAVIDAVLVGAAEALIRIRARRPNWLPKGFPMKLILSLKREQRLDFIADDTSLRAGTRTPLRRAPRPYGRSAEAERSVVVYRST